MPWSPIPKFPDIIRDLARQGYKKQTNFEPLKTAIMRQTQVITPKTIKRVIMAMEQLGFLRADENGMTWTIKKKVKK